MQPLKNVRHEKFALALFKGKSQKDAAIEAGYKTKNCESIASRLVKKSQVFQRILDLQEMAESDAIMSVIQRKERLSEIARARLTDFVEAGADGSYINVGLESVNSAALKKVKSRTEYDKDGANAAVITKLELHDPIRAIAELNKMERVYEPEGSVLIDNRTLTINVNSEKAKELTQRIIEGEKTGGDNDH